MRELVAILIITTFITMPALALDTAGNAANPQAIEEVTKGTRDTANAAWWGFKDEDSTEAIQAAINSRAKHVVVPNMGKDWIVRPVTLAGNQELILEDGVVITAKRGEYRAENDSVFTASNLENLTIRGYGATVRMQKEDYIVGKVLLDLKWNRWFGQYEKAEWRMALSLRGCTNVIVYGITLRDSGGDGLYIAGGRNRQPCKNIHIQDVTCDNNYRQGVSIINVDGLLVENSVFSNTWGTPPSAGVDIEPDSPNEMVKDIVFRKCRISDNYGDGIEVHLPRLKKDSVDASILFEDCRVTSRRGPGIRVSKIHEDGVGGLIEFRRCQVENTEAYGINIQDKDADRCRLRFVKCVLKNVAINRNYGATWAPVCFNQGRVDKTPKFGGLDFVDCRIEDSYDRPAILFEKPEDSPGLFDVTGTFEVKNPAGVRVDLGEKKTGVTLAIKPAE